MWDGDSKAKLKQTIKRDCLKVAPKYDECSAETRADNSHMIFGSNRLAAASL